MPRLRKVRGRNGEIIPFSQGRVAASIREAVSICGLEDEVLADELAGVVTLFLEKSYDDASPPDLDDVREMIGRVLVETGHARVSQAYLRLRGRGETVEEAAVALGPGLRPDAPVEVVGHADGLVETWDRDVLVRSLVQEILVPESEAREIASEVEERILGSGLGRVTSALVREFVDVELARRGHEAQLVRNRLLGVSRRRVESWLLPEDGRVLDPEEACARRLLADYALEEVCSRPVARAHLDGRIHVQGLGHPQRVETVTLDATGPLLDREGSPQDFVLELVTLLQSVRPLARRRIVVARFAEAYASLKKRPNSRRGVARWVGRLLDHLLRVDVFGRSVFPPVTLSVRLTGEHLEAADDKSEAGAVRLLAEVLLEELERRSALDDRLGLSFVLAAAKPYAWPESRTLKRLLNAARRHPGVSLLLLRDPEAARAGAPLGDRSVVVLDVGAVAVNVPAALALADVRDVEAIVQALEGAFGLAVDAVFEKYWFLRRSAPETLRGLLSRLPGGGRMRIEGAGQGGQLLLWGLPQALAYLERRGVFAAGEGAGVLARILGAADYIAGEERESIRLRITIGGVSDRGVRARLVEATDRIARRLGDADLLAALSEGVGERATLPLDSPLLSDRNMPVLRSRVLDRMGTGLPLPARGDDEIASGVWLRALFERTRLSHVEFEERVEVFEVQEPLFEEEAGA